MAKQSINVGATANDRTGDSLRSAFNKVNENFTELYTALGLDSGGLNLGAFEFTGSTISTTDSSAIVIDQAVTVNSNLTIGGDLLPSLANGGNLGSVTQPFRSLYVSNATVYLGGVPLSLEPGTNTLKVNNVPISQNITYEQIPDAPRDVRDLTDNDNLLGGGGGADLGDFTINGNVLEAEEMTIRTNDADLFIESDSDVFVKSSGGNHEWKFDTSGKLTFPGSSPYATSGGMTIQNQSGDGTTYLDGNGNDITLQVNTTKTIYIKVGDAEWSFGNAGSYPDTTLKLPEGGDIVDSNGDSVLGGANTANFQFTEGHINYTGNPEAFIGNGPASLTLNDDYPSVKLQATSSRFSSYNTGAWTGNAVWSIGGPGGQISFVGVTQEFTNWVNSLSRYVRVYLNINGFNTTYNGASVGGGNVTIYTDDEPDDNNTVVTSIEFNAEFENRLVFDADEDDYGIRLDNDDFNIQTGDKRFTFSSNGAFRLPEGGDILDSNGDSVLGAGGGVAGLSGNTSFTPTQSRDTAYELDINNQIKLRTTYSGNLGPGIGLGNGAGQSAATGVIAIGNSDVGLNGKQGGVYIGYEAGWNDSEQPQGEYAIAIGAKAARNIARDNTITLNATGVALDPAATNGLYIKPIRENYNDKALYYNTTTGEVTYDVISNYTGDFIFDGTIFAHPENGHFIDFDADVAGNLSIVANNGKVAKITSGNEIRLTVGDTEHWAMVTRSQQNASGSGVEAAAVIYDSNDNVIMIHSKDVDGDDHLVISKFTPYGALTWQKQISDQMDPDQSHDLALDSSDNIIVAISNETGPFNDILIFKFNCDNGSVMWQKEYTPSVPVPVVEGDLNLVNTVVGGGSHLGNPVQTVYIQGQWPDLTGYTFRSHPGDNNFTTYGTIIYNTYQQEFDQTVLFFAAGTFVGDLNGALYYSATGLAPNSWKELGSMVVSGDNIFVSGRYTENNNGGNSQAFLFKTSVVDGSLDWYKAFNFASNNTYGYGMEVGADGNPVVVGVGTGDAPDGAWVTKFDAETGDALWSNVIFNGEENVSYTGSDVTVDSQNNIYVSVNANQTIVHDDGNDTGVTIAYIVKLNSTGTIQWTRRAGPGPCGSVATGIDHDIEGNVYLAALTTAQKNPVRDFSETAWNTGINQNVLAVCKYNSAGQVLWQRYVKSDFYDFLASRDEGTDEANWNANNNRGRALSVSSNGKIAVQVTVKQRDPDNYTVNDPLYESITFQINQDGRTLTLGSGTALFTVEESRIPGRFVTVPGTRYYDPAVATNNDITEDVVVSTPEFNVFDGILAQELSTSAAYDYKFGNDGTLTIPNDGDVRLTQTEVGWFSVYGPATNNNENVDVRAHCVDPNTGDIYIVGESDDLGRGFVARYNNQGQILWSISTYENGDGMSNRANAVKIHPTNGNVVVLLEVYGMQTNSVLLQIDPDTAKVVTSVGVRDTGNQGSCIAYDFDFMTNGNIVVVGRKWDEYRSRPVTALAGSSSGSLVISKSDITGLTPDTNWYISGSGITGRTVVTSVTDNGETWTITVTDPIPFGDPGSWYTEQPLGGESFILVGGGLEFAISWTKVLSAGVTDDTERYLSVAVDSDNNIYAAGEMIARSSVAGADLDNYWCAVVTKFAGNGTHQWTKALNDTTANCYAKCVVVRGNTVVVSHNNTNQSSTIISKLDSTGSIKWQRKTNSNDDSSVAIDSNGDIYAVVEANFENKFGDIIKLIRFNTTGEITWRKFFGSVTVDNQYEADRFKNGRNLNLYGDSIYVSGYTYLHADNRRNGFMVKLPKAGDCDGFYGAWAVQLETYNVEEVTTTEATAFTPVIGTGEFEVVGYDMISNWWDPSEDDYYHTLDIIRDRDGGAIEFADGTRQTSSAQQIPQRRLSNGESHRLCIDDMGKHIFIKNNDSQIAVPYNVDNPLPIGFTVVIVNDTGGTVNIPADGGEISIRSGSNTGSYWYVESYGMATLIKVDTDYWYISGNVGQP